MNTLKKHTFCGFAVENGSCPPQSLSFGMGRWWVVGGRVAFRKYDNDSDARRRGTYELTCSPMRGGCGCDAP